MRIFLCLIFLSACAPRTTTNETPIDPAIVRSGQLQNAAIAEASGLTRSNLSDQRLWVLNDGGSPPLLYALGEDGSDEGSVRLRNTKNVDWEDLASFKVGDRSWLVVADIGDNLAKREHVTLYVVEEPDLADEEATPSWLVNFRYPDGPKDAEALAVDVAGKVAYVLAKRTVPARLYSVPLRPDESNQVVTASYLGTIGTIPQPTQVDLDRALAEKNWHWQPTAMEFSRDGSTAIILTYRAMYYYHRQDDEPWFETLQRTPVAFDLGSIREAESASLGLKRIFFTVEARHAPLYRIEIGQ